jgi:hypothetical protein
MVISQYALGLLGILVAWIFMAHFGRRTLYITGLCIYSPFSSSLEGWVSPRPNPHPGLFWVGITLLCIVWCIFRLPESKDRTYAELNVLFEHRVPAWKFKGAKVDAFRGESIAIHRLSTTESKRVGSDIAGRG